MTRDIEELCSDNETDKLSSEETRWTMNQQRHFIRCVNVQTSLTDYDM